MSFRLLPKTLLLCVSLLLILTAVPFALAQDDITLIPTTNEAYGYTSVAPDGWTDVGQGIYARQSSPEDATIIAQQSAPLAADVLLESLLPQMGLTEVPESAGTHTGVLDWTLYDHELSRDAMTAHFSLALSQVDGTTYLVLLFASPDDYDALYESVFLPALDAFAPIEEVEVEVPYVVEDVTFENGEITLAGTLTLPPTDGPHPVLVLVSGSGPQDRDESLGGGIAIKPFRLLADALTRAGVAVLRYDDRGVGDSTGVFADALVSDFASDAEAAIAYLLTRDEIDPDQIGLLGHSEGGLVAAMLGATNPDLDFLIVLAGPGVIGRDVLILQNELLMEAEGASPEAIALQVEYVTALIDVLDDPDAMQTLTYDFAIAQAELMTDDELAAVGDIEAYASSLAEQVVGQYGTGWLESFLTYDPALDWAQTTVPVLAIFGGKDVQVDAEQNAPAMQAALDEAGNTDAEIVTLPDANHLFQAADTGGLSEYAALPAEFAPDFIPTILDWLEAHVEIAE